MVEPTEAWATEFQFLINAMARSVENVRLAVKEEASKAQAEERMWLRADVHTVLNIIQGILLHSGALVYEVAQLTIQPKNGNSIDSYLLDKLEVIEKASAFAYNELSQLMYELRQPTLRDQGFAFAIEEFGCVLGLDDCLNLQVDNRYAEAISKQASHILYRIAQEAINNAHKHSKVTEKVGGSVEVILKPLSGNKWCLAINDNGNGFPDKSEIITKKLTSYGLLQIRKWAKDLNGKAQIESRVDNGTSIRILFPCENT
jgi:signal transduction histidine kinase